MKNNLLNLRAISVALLAVVSVTQKNTSAVVRQFYGIPLRRLEGNSLYDKLVAGSFRSGWCRYGAGESGAAAANLI